MLQFIAAQQRNAAVPILAGVSLLGAGIYYTTKKHPEVSATQDRHEKLQSKLDEGLGAAGIGGDATTGGHDYGQNQDRVQGTTAPKEDLPSGGVGGGVGEEMSAKKRPGTSSTGSVSTALEGVFGIGASTAGTGTDYETKDTRVASNLKGTVTKQDKDKPVYADHRNPRVPRGKNKNQEEISGISGSPGK
ncbi:hypothetical protein QYS62_011477 [Fusarium acuminatum]|uniref:Uncharacterized protein n=1 Tax=Fusarium acuminatum TaxID=5515 RepID=A0ABZ2XB21_9HYPO